MDRAYAGNGYPCKISGQENHPRTLGEMVRAVVYVWNSYEMVPMDGKVDGQSQKSNVRMKTDCQDSTVSVASVQIDVHQAESWNLPLESSSQSISFAEKVLLMKVDTAGGICNSNNLQPMKVSSDFSQAITSYDNCGKSVPIHKFSREINESVEIVTNPDQSTEVSYLLREVQEEHFKKSGSP